MLSKDQVKHIAKLARIGLDDAACEKFAGQLSSIFSYVELLNEVDVSSVSPTSQVTGLQNVSRADNVARFCEREELLESSPLPKERDQIKVKPVITN